MHNSIAEVLRLAKARQYVPNTEMFLQQWLVDGLWIADSTHKIKLVRMRAVGCYEYIFRINSIYRSIATVNRSMSTELTSDTQTLMPYDLEAISFGCCPGSWLQKSHFPTELAS